jgi:O-antigen ligase
LGLALVPLQALAILAGAGLALMLPALDPIFGVYLAILSVPVQNVVRLPGGLSYTQAAMLLATFWWGLRVLAHPERSILAHRSFRTGVQAAWWAALLWALLLSTMLSPFSRAEGFKETLRWAEAFAIWLMVIGLVRRRWHVVGLLVCLLLAPAAEAAIGLAQFVSGVGPPSFRIAAGLPYVRAYGTIGQPNSFAGYLNMAWPLALALALGALTPLMRRDHRPETNDQNAGTRPQKRLLRFGSWSVVVGLLLATGLLVGGLVASLSRGAWAGAVCGALGMAVSVGRRARSWTLGALGVAALALALGGGILPAFVAERLASTTRYLALFDAGSVTITPANFAIVERMSQMQAGWRMFLARPIIGVGPGNYTFAYPDYAVGTWYASRGHAHNYYIHMAAEAGFLGLAAYLALLASLIPQAVAMLRRTRRTFWHSVVVGCCGIIAAVVAHDLFENLHVLSMGIQLAAVWGLLNVVDDRVIE